MKLSSVVCEPVPNPFWRCLIRSTLRTQDALALSLSGNWERLEELPRALTALMPPFHEALERAHRGQASLADNARVLLINTKAAIVAAARVAAQNEGALSLSPSLGGSALAPNTLTSMRTLVRDIRYDELIKKAGPSFAPIFARRPNVVAVLLLAGADYWSGVGWDDTVQNTWLTPTPSQTTAWELLYTDQSIPGVYNQLLLKVKDQPQF